MAFSVTFTIDEIYNTVHLEQLYHDSEQVKNYKQNLYTALASNMLTITLLYS